LFEFEDEDEARGGFHNPKFIRVLPGPFVIKYVPSNMDSKKLARLCRESAENKKAENVVILDVRKLSSVTDYFVIASGTSEPHLRAIVEEITGRLREEHGVRPRAMDGTVHGAWVVLDFFDVIVHVMRQDARDRYDLESLWGDAARVTAKKKPSRKKL